MGWVRSLAADFALWRAERNEKAAEKWLRVWRRLRQIITRD